MGKNDHPRRRPGSGQAAKICNNMILGVSMIAVCEAFVLGRAAGPRPAEALRHRLEVVGPVLVADQLLPGAGPGAGLAGEPRLPGRLRHGDDAEGSQARAAGGRRGPAPRRRWAPRPSSSSACSNAGNGGKDFSAIIKMLDGNMITLYDLAFDKDLRPSPYCWRAKLAMKHKGLAWRDEPCGFSREAEDRLRPVADLSGDP